MLGGEHRAGQTPQRVGDTLLFSPDIQEPPMTVSWESLFERANTYDVALEEIQTANDDCSDSEAATDA